MNAIVDLAKYGAERYQHIIGPAVAAIPLAIEGGILANKLYQNPKIPQEAKEWIVHHFSPNTDENVKNSAIRISKNVALSLGGIALSGAAVYFTAAFLPLAAAVPVALSILFHAGKQVKTLPDFVKKFEIHEGEDPTLAKKRIQKLTLKTAAKVMVAVALVALAAYALYPFFTTGFQWNIPLPIPQTKPVVFAEYATVGAVHLGLAAKNLKKEDKQKALFHLFSGALSFIFPTYYWNNQMRLHHSFLGLILMATPYRPAKFIGSVITFDSSLYFISPKRGVGGYDFMNTFFDRFPLFSGTLGSSLFGQGVNDTLK